MAKYLTQWDEATVGDNPPAGWTRRGDASGTPANYLFPLAYGAPAVKRRQISASALGASLRSAISYDAVDGDADRDDADILLLVKIPASGIADSIFVYARGAGTSSMTDAYVAEFSPAANAVATGKIVSSSFSYLGAASGFAFNAGDSVFLRFRVIGTAIKSRAWVAGSVEPSTWLQEFTDSDVTAAGWLAWGIYSSTGTKTMVVNVVSAGTGGDVAPTPLLNTEFAAWLARQDVQRCVLVEMEGKGSQSGPDQLPITVYVSNTKFASRSWDSPANTGYLKAMVREPSLSQSMGEALRGEASVGAGSFEIDNSSGVRDKWLRMKWRGKQVRILYGDPSWPRHDFRTQILGRMQQPTAPSMDRIEFQISDLSDMLRVDIQTNSIASGPYANKPKPILLGLARYIDPVPIDTATLEYQVHDGAIYPFSNAVAWPVLDNFVAIDSQGITVSAVNTGTETITATAAHGLLENWRVRFDTGTPPAPLALDTDYWVIAAGLTSADLRLSATRGGSAINLTGSTTGATFNGYGYDWNDSTGIIQLASQPAGRVLVAAALVPSGFTIGSIIGWILTTKLGISANYIDQDALDALDAAITGNVGMWIGPNARTAIDVIGEALTRLNCWHGWTPDGLFTCGQIDSPAASATLSLTEDDVTDLRLEKSLLGATSGDGYFGKITYQPRNYALGIPQDAGGDYGIASLALAAPSSPAPSIWFDIAPDADDIRPSSEVPTLDSIFDSTSDAEAERARMNTLFRFGVGTFATKTRLPACQLSIGQTISLEHSRMEWREFATDETSDLGGNFSGSVDSRLAVVVAKSVDLSERGPFKVALKLWRPIHGFYPDVANIPLT